MGLFFKAAMTPYEKILSRYYGGLDVSISDAQMDNIDAYGISYPKCGRTWLKVFLQTLYLRHYGQVNFDGTIFYAGDAPKMLFAHTGYYYTPKKPTIFIIRDPRDVIVSFWHHVRTRGPGSMHKYKAMSLSDFVRDKDMGIPAMVRYYKTWRWRLKRCKRLMVIRYEDMVTRDIEVFNDIHNFLGLKASIKDLLKAVDFCRFDNMKKELEKPDCGAFANHPQLVDLKPASDDPNSAKVRRGKVGGYVDELKKEDIAYIDGMIKKFPKQWRYDG